MTPEPDWVARQVERKKASLDELLARYRQLYEQAQSDNPVLREVAKSSLVSLWNTIQAGVSGWDNDS